MATSHSTQKAHAQVIIVGAGPVGMLTALRLGQAGIDTLVVEGHEALLNTTRAMVYMPVVIPVLRQLGILDTVLQQAYLNTKGVTWRDIDGKTLANLPLSSSDPTSFGGVILLGQWRMNALVLEELKKYPSVQVRFNTKLTDINDDPSSPAVRLTARNTKEPSSPPITLTASYVLGTDGANSPTRRLLNLDFNGYTFTQFRMIGIDVLYDFIHHQAFNPLNFIVHPTDWAVIAFTGQDEGGLAPGTTDNPQWRVAYVEDPSLPDDPASIWARAEKQMAKYATSGKPCKLIRAEPYTMHQRCASQAIKGRVALAGDALHSNNPIGGLGLTGGILDAFCYGNALVRVIAGGESVDVLTRCAESRLAAWKNATNKMSEANIERLYSMEEETAKARNGLFEKLNGPAREAVAGNIRKGMDGMMGDDFSNGVEKWIGGANHRTTKVNGQ